MTPTVLPTPQFTNLTEDEVIAGLANLTPGNPLVVELHRLVQGYMQKCRAQMELLGDVPNSFLYPKPQAAIEAIAMRLTIGAIQEAISHRVP